MIRSIYLVDFALFVKGKITNFTRLANTFKNKCLDLKFIDGLILNVIYNLFKGTNQPNLSKGEVS